MNAVEKQPLVHLAAGLGVQLSALQIRLLQLFLDELWTWNRKINLIGVSSRERVVQELLLDSLIPCPLLPEKGKLLDVGSGSGFPAIPIKIWRPGLWCHLVEATSKKVSFLRHVIRLTSLRNIQVIQGRVEDKKTPLHSDGYEIITARAFGDMKKVLLCCAPHLKRDGMMVSFLGGHAERILEENLKLMDGQGMFPLKLIPYLLPGKKRERTIVILKKCT